MYFLIILAFNFNISTNTVAHDFHLSMCESLFNEREQSLQMSLRMFYDDLEKAMSDDQTSVIFERMSGAKTDSILEAYVNKHFKIFYDGEEMEVEFIGNEFQEDELAVWCYLEIPGRPLPNKLSLMNNILCEEFDDQQNIIQFGGPKGRKEYLIFDKDSILKELSF